MAITITPDQRRAERIEKGAGTATAILSGTIKDTAYATGGTSLTDLSKYFTTIKRVVVDCPLGYLGEYVPSTNKLLIYATADTVAGTRVEVGNGTDLTAAVFNFIAVGVR